MVAYLYLIFIAMSVIIGNIALGWEFGAGFALGILANSIFFFATVLKAFETPKALLDRFGLKVCSFCGAAFCNWDKHRKRQRHIEAVRNKLGLDRCER